MGTLFDQLTRNGMTLRNHLFRSATWEGMCEPDGRPTQRLIDCYRNLAKGGVGLIITGYTFVSREGKQLPGKMGIHVDDFADEMRALTRAVHEQGGKICIQLVHAGGQTDSKNAGQRPLAPSAVKVDQYPELPAELFKEEIARLVAAFADAARRAKEYGFDAVQFHGAHGYLINQFLSPLTNRRDDEYGGSIENRCHFMLEVYRAVREAVGNDFPVMIKLNGCDNLEGGLSAANKSTAKGELLEIRQAEVYDPVNRVILDKVGEKTNSNSQPTTNITGRSRSPSAPTSSRIWPAIIAYPAASSYKPDGGRTWLISGRR